MDLPFGSQKNSPNPHARWGLKHADQGDSKLSGIHSHHDQAVGHAVVRAEMNPVLTGTSTAMTGLAMMSLARFMHLPHGVQCSLELLPIEFFILVGIEFLE
jgi:hypothetical protein